MIDYEKKYKEAMARAKSYWDNDRIMSIRSFAEYIFPELKESEDEKIRKAILELVRQSSEILDKQNQNNMIAWLEKQKDHEAELERAYKTADEVQYRRGYEDAKRELEKQGEQKPSWSEEDEEYLRRAINATKDGYPMTAKWLKLLKERLKRKR